MNNCNRETAFERSVEKLLGALTILLARNLALHTRLHIKHLQKIKIYRVMNQLRVWIQRNHELDQTSDVKNAIRDQLNDSNNLTDWNGKLEETNIQDKQYDTIDTTNLVEDC